MTALRAIERIGSGGIGIERRLTNHSSVSSRLTVEHEVAHDAAIHVRHRNAVTGAADGIDRGTVVQRADLRRRIRGDGECAAPTVRDADAA